MELEFIYLLWFIQRHQWAQYLHSNRHALIYFAMQTALTNAFFVEKQYIIIMLNILYYYTYKKLFLCIKLY